MLSTGLVPAHAMSMREEEPCRFVEGFAAFHAELGDDIVGDCLFDQESTESGDAIQFTTRGLFKWSRTLNAMFFEDDERQWIAGTGGLRGPVRVSDTSHMGAQASGRPITTLDVLSKALLAVRDMPPGWSYSESDSIPTALTSSDPACDEAGRAGQQNVLGSVGTVLIDAEGRRLVTHDLRVVPAGQGATAFGGIEAFMRACPESRSSGELNGQRYEVVTRFTVSAARQRGDGAFEYQTVNTTSISGGPTLRTSSMTSVIRYGDVISQIAAPASQPEDLLRLFEQKLAALHAPD